MNELKKLLIAGLGLVVTVGLVGCDVETECDEAGVCADGGAGGAGGGAGGQGGQGGQGGAGGGGATYDWVLVIDDSAEENMAGTPGVDICGISANCGGNVASVAALLTPGDGELCDSVREGCSAVRTDPNAARDDGSACEGGSNPSDYVSLGIGGLLSVQFAQALPGCDLEVVELVGNDAEAYDVYVCDAADAATATCANNDQPIATAGEGGTVNVTVP